MKTIAWVGAGAALGLGAALAVAGAHGAADPSAYGQIGTFSEAFAKVRANYVDPVQDQELIKSAVQGMVSGLDPHSAYMDAKAFGGDFQARTQGRFGGVGIQVVPDAGVIRVVSPMDGMPAAAAGIKPGDKITAINGNAVQGRDFNDAINSMRGPVGSKVTLTVERDGEKKPFDVSLVRAD